MRLIDADELKEVIYRSSVDTREKINNIIDNAPTVDTDIVPLMQDIVANIPEIVDKVVKLYIEERRSTMTKEEIIKELWNCRNELCLKCERYKEAYRGACEDCRYNFVNMQKWKGEQE